jgi:hypothetical protein
MHHDPSILPGRHSNIMFLHWTNMMSTTLAATGITTGMGEFPKNQSTSFILRAHSSLLLPLCFLHAKLLFLPNHTCPPLSMPIAPVPHMPPLPRPGVHVPPLVLAVHPCTPYSCDWYG